MTVSLPTPTLHLTPASDTGVSHSDGVTDDPVPVIAGTATPGALVTITDADSGLSVQARADKYGNYVATFAGLQAGVHGLTASATDANGNVSATSNPLAIDIETAATATSTPALVPDTAESVTFAVHFNQPVSAVRAASFTLVSVGDAYGNVEFISGSGQDYSVTVAGLGGTGAVALAFSANAPTDVAGNQIALSSTLHEVSDTTAGVLTTVSTDKSGVQGTGASPAPSRSGAVVAFISDDPDLVPGGQTTPGVGNAYVKRLTDGQIVEVTNGNESDPILNVEIAGNIVAFSSRATNLVPGGTPVGQLNLYVAELTVTSGVASLVPGSTELVGALNPEVYLYDEAGFALSGDGSTLAYEGDTTLADGTTDAPGEFIYNLNTGVTTQFQFAAPGDGTSLSSGNITSISADGTRIAYTASVPVPGTGGQPDIYTGGTVPPNLIQDAFVYDTTSKTTFTIDGSGLLPGTTPPTGENQEPSYETQYPVLSGDGSTVVFQVERGGQDAGVSLFSVNLANPSVF